MLQFGNYLMRNSVSGKHFCDYCKVKRAYRDFLHEGLNIYYFKKRSNVSCKKILINKAKQGYGVSDHYVNSLNISFVDMCCQ